MGSGISILGAVERHFSAEFHRLQKVCGADENVWIDVPFSCELMSLCEIIHLYLFGYRTDLNARFS